LDPGEYEIMYGVEDRHWWYQGMETITRATIERWVHPTSDFKILDAGCGTGAAMTTYLADYGMVTGCDIHPLALDFCRKRNAHSLACASVSDLPFASAIFDLITSFDVLYERAVPSDLSALREFYRVLVPGGRLLLRLPAYDWLRGQHDRLVHTSRRYTINRVSRLLAESGFMIEHLSYANTFLFPMAVLKRLSEKIVPARGGHSDLALETGRFNKILRAILSAEAPLAAGMGLPFGLSVIAVGVKR
jgi:SAM-dependent methyltransferase